MNVDNLSAALPASVVAELKEILKTRQISKVQLCAFLANCKHESGNFKAVEENLNYSATGLAKTFPKRYSAGGVPNALANSLHRKPEKIANNLYSNRMGNGTEASGEGWKYRGRGYIQLTGKSNYMLFDATVVDNITENPDLVATKYPLTSAMWFFDANKLWVLAAQSENINSFKSLVKRINGGYNGMAEREQNFKKFMSMI